MVPKKVVKKWRLILDISLPEASRWDSTRALLPLVHICRPHCQDVHTGRPRGSPGKGGHKERLPPSPGPPQKQAAPRNGLGQCGVRGHHTTIWSALGPKDLHSPGRCTRVQTVLQYLDDFLIVDQLGQPNADQCAVDP